MKYQLSALSALIAILSSGSTMSAPHQSMPEKDFKIIILKENWWDLKISYEAEKEQSVLSSVDVSDPVFVITKGQI